MESKAGTNAPVKKVKQAGAELFQKALAECEAKIEENAKGFWVSGAALLAIKEKKLYKYSTPPYETFKEYAKGRWGYASRAYQLTAAAEIRQTLIDCGLENPDGYSEEQYRLDFKAIKKLAKSNKDEKLKELLEGKELSSDELKEGLMKLLPEPKPRPLKKEKLEAMRKKRVDRLVASVHKQFDKLCAKNKLEMSWDSFIAILEKA